MESQPQVNLRQFVSKKSNKKFLIKFSVYVLVIAALSVALLYQLSKHKNQKVPLNEIRGVQIEISQ